MKRLVISLSDENRIFLEEEKRKTGKSFGMIIRDLIAGERKMRLQGTVKYKFMKKGPKYEGREK